MAGGRHATVGGRRLGAELRAIRKEKGYGLREIAGRLGWQPSKISRIETGKQGVTKEDVASLLALYGITGTRRDEVVAKAETVDDSGYWEIQGPLSPESRTLIHLESQARRIVTCQPLLVPGLVQTAEYTRAVMRSGGVDSGDADVAVAARLGRQAVLSREHPPEFEAIIDEGVLHRPILPPAQLAIQFRRLLDVMRGGRAWLRVLPLKAGAHAGLDGSFTLLEFSKESPVVYLDHRISGVFLEEEDQVEFFRAQLERLRATAASPEESLQFVADAIRSWDGRE